MTREDIIRMAREAGLSNDFGHLGYPYLPELERFASLAAAAERNKVAQWMIARSYATGHGDTVEDLLKELAQSVREEERELCAQMCDEIANKPSNMVLGVALDCAAAIRARGEK
jgi:hypothetical protein